MDWTWNGRRAEAWDGRWSLSLELRLLAGFLSVGKFRRGCLQCLGSLEPTNYFSSWMHHQNIWKLRFRDHGSKLFSSCELNRKS